MINLPKKNSYELPEGYYTCVLYEIFFSQRNGRGEPEETLRMVYRITSLTHPRYVYFAGKNYKLSDATSLAKDLDTWLGKELDTLVGPNGEIFLEQLETLKGRAADIEIVLIDNDDYPTAYRHIVRITPPGILVERLDGAA